MENKENSLKEKTFSFLQRRWMDVAAFLALIVFSIYTGINFWFFLGMGLFLTLLNVMSGKKGSYQTAANIMRWIFVLVFIAIVLAKFFPRANMVKIRAWTAIDQTIADLAPSTAKTKAKDLFNLEKEKASEAFLLYYQELLSEGKIKEAQDTLLGFEEFWAFKLESKTSSSRAVSAEPVVIEQPVVRKIEVQKPKTVALRDSNFYRGTYYININGQTPFRINVISNKSCNRYNLSSQGGGYYIVSNKDVTYDAPGIKTQVPYQEKPRFVLKADQPTVVKLVVH